MTIKSELGNRMLNLARENSKESKKELSALLEEIPSSNMSIVAPIFEKYGLIHSRVLNEKDYELISIDGYKSKLREGEYQTIILRIRKK